MPGRGLRGSRGTNGGPREDTPSLKAVLWGMARGSGAGPWVGAGQWGWLRAGPWRRRGAVTGGDLVPSLGNWIWCLSNTAGESALVYPPDLWLPPGSGGDGRNSATPLTGTGGPVVSSAPWAERTWGAAPSTPPSPCGVPREEPRDAAALSAEEPEQGAGLRQRHSELKAKVGKFGSVLRHQ